MSGKKDALSTRGIISQKAFADPIIKYIYDENDRYELRDELKKYKDKNHMEDDFEVQNVFAKNKYDSSKYILWQFYASDKEELLYKILLNYFCALSNILEDDWEFKYQSVLLKTTGYNALMKLFSDVYIMLYDKRNFTFDKFMEVLKPLRKLSGKITAAEYGASGASSTNRLYKDLYNLITK